MRGEFESVDGDQGRNTRYIVGGVSAVLLIGVLSVHRPAASVQRPTEPSKSESERPDTVSAISWSGGGSGGSEGNGGGESWQAYLCRHIGGKFCYDDWHGGFTETIATTDSKLVKSSGTSSEDWHKYMPKPPPGGWGKPPPGGWGGGPGPAPKPWGKDEIHCCPTIDVGVQGPPKGNQTVSHLTCSAANHACLSKATQFSVCPTSQHACEQDCGMRWCIGDRTMPKLTAPPTEPKTEAGSPSQPAPPAKDGKHNDDKKDKTATTSKDISGTTQDAGVDKLAGAAVASEGTSSSNQLLLVLGVIMAVLFALGLLKVFRKPPCSDYEML